MREGYKPQLQASQLLAKMGTRSGNEHCSPFPSPVGPGHPCLGRARALCGLHLSSCPGFLWSWEPGWGAADFFLGQQKPAVPHPGSQLPHQHPLESLHSIL